MSKIEDLLIKAVSGIETAVDRTSFIIKKRFDLLSPISILPFKGVSAFYQALQKGKEGTANNPIFYVSSSPWNLYDLLLHFCEVHDIPKGPFLLRDLGVSTGKFIKTRHIDYKVKKIENAW